MCTLALAGEKIRELKRKKLCGCFWGDVATRLNSSKRTISEVAGYSDDRWEAPQRAARLAAAVKRYKTSEMLRFIFATIAYDPDPDLTPLAVKRLCQSPVRQNR